MIKLLKTHNQSFIIYSNCLNELPIRDLMKPTHHYDKHKMSSCFIKIVKSNIDRNFNDHGRIVSS